MGYACEGVELCKHILCVQIGCMRHWGCYSSITAVIRGSAFKGFLRHTNSFAT